MVRKKRREEISKAWVRKGKRLVRLEGIEVHSEGTLSNVGITLLHLPDECLLMIFEKLSHEPQDICKLMTVCKRFYTISSSPRLWRVADFRLSSYLRKFTKMCIVSRRRMFAEFLAQRRARLSHLELYCDIYRELNTFSDLVQRCCSKELKYVEIKWTFFWSVLYPERREATLRCFREILAKLSACSPNIYFLKTELDGSCTTTRMLGDLKNIHHLELHYLDQLEYSMVDENYLRPIEIILFSLPKLKILKLKVRQNLDDDFSGYVLKSNSLEHLDYSYSKGLRIKELSLPNLHTFIAVSVFNFLQGKSSPCLFELIEKGCPDLTTFNCTHSKESGLQNFALTDNDKRKTHLCQCRNHCFIRSQQ